MEDYKNIFRQIVVPSLFILLAITASIHESYNSALSRQPGYFTIALAIISIILFPIICLNSFPGPGKIMHAVRTPRAMGLILLTAASAACIQMTVSSLMDRKNLPVIEKNRNIFHGVIGNVTATRYNRLGEIKIIHTDGDSSHDDIGGAPRILGFFPGNSKIRPGDEIVFFSKIRDLHGEPPSPQSLQEMRKGIRYTISLMEKDYDIVRPEQARGLEDIKDMISRMIDACFSHDTGGLVKALFYGNKDTVSKEEIRAYRRAGVMHILAASGFNVGIVSAIPFFILGLAGINKKIIFIVAIAAVGFYLALTGIQVSLLRACLMFSIFSLCAALDLDRNIFNALFISAAVILLLYPYELYSIGFQLSFGATFGILLFHKFYKISLAGLPGPVANSLALTLSAQIFVIPVILIEMSELNLSGIISNMIIVPLTSAIMVLSIITLVLSVLSMNLAMVPGYATDMLYRLNSFAVENISGINGHFYIDKLQPLLIIPFILLLIPLLPVKKKKFISLSIAASLALSWAVLASGTEPPRSINLFTHAAGRVMMIKVNDRAYLTGSIPGIRESGEISKFIEKSGVIHMEIMINRPDFSNIRSYIHVIKKGIIKKIYLSSKYRFDDTLKELFKLIDDEKIALEIFDERGLHFNPEFERFCFGGTNSCNADETIPVYQVIEGEWHMEKIRQTAPSFSIREFFI